MPTLPIPINLEHIQGNSFGGFNKDFQTFIFFSIGAATKPGIKTWLGSIVPEVANSSSAKVIEFNNIFKQLAADGIREGLISATWTNLAFTSRGLTALDLKGVLIGGIAGFPIEFTDGMAKRAAGNGDSGPSDPIHWHYGSPTKPIDGVILLASDIHADLILRVAAAVKDLTANGLTVVHTEHGRVRADQPGHEHFGFKDGVSQPGVRGIDLPDDPLANPDQGHPGQDLLWPGEFVLGYPTQIPSQSPGVNGPNPNPGVPSTSGPSWTKDGSYLVFRRLAQDVQGFHAMVAAKAAAYGTTPDLLGAKMVGRYRSGAPLERRRHVAGAYVPPLSDPGVADPALGNDASLNNDFEYGADPTGLIVPLASHIRKAYPRDEQLPGSTPAESESVTQTHRLLRRGIPFGSSLGAECHGSASDQRGLLFLAYQRSIEDQFEFVQRSWVNNVNFPATGAGQDPIIAQSPSAPFPVPPAFPTAATAPTLAHFVTTQGGEYFFAPSIPVLNSW
jgi:Dyp-type peroxidase family